MIIWQVLLLACASSSDLRPDIYALAPEFEIRRAESCESVPAHVVSVHCFELSQGGETASIRLYQFRRGDMGRYAESIEPLGSPYRFGRNDAVYVIDSADRRFGALVYERLLSVEY